MPELPEVERGRALAASIAEDRVIVRTYCQLDPIVFCRTSGATFAKALRGKQVREVCRWGKQLWFELNAGPHPLFHFGMTGAFRARAVTPLQLKSGPVERSDRWPPRFTKIRLWMDDDGELVMTDARRLGRIPLRDDPVNQPPLSALGFDPYLALASLSVFREGVRRRATPIKSLLLDQRFCAGVGNWLADEILYQAGVDPRRSCPTLSDSEIRVIRRCMKTIVGKAVATNAEDSQYPRRWLFHHRWGKNAAAKTARGEPIEFVDIGGRTTAWVPSVQR